MLNRSFLFPLYIIYVELSKPLSTAILSIWTPRLQAASSPLHLPARSPALAFKSADHARGRNSRSSSSKIGRKKWDKGQTRWGLSAYKDNTKAQDSSTKSTHFLTQQKEESFDKKRQKKDRNVPSNIFRFFITFLFQHQQPLKALNFESTYHEEALKSCIAQVK